MKLKHETDKNKSTEPPETKPSSAMQCTDDQLVHLETSPIQWPWSRAAEDELFKLQKGNVYEGFCSK